MNRQHIYLTRLLGIPVYLDYSWFFIFILMTWMFAVSYFPMELPGQSPAYYWLASAVTAILLFGSVLLHELGHSILALRFNLPVSEIDLFVFGGVARIVGEPPRPASEFWIALAGPVTNIIIATILLLLKPLFVPLTILYPIIKYLIYINFVLAVFNLIPGFPLDGGRIFRALVWAITGSMRKATLVAGNVGRVIAFAFIFWGVLEIFSGRVSDGLWLIFIGWFLESAARAQMQQVELRAILSAHRVSEAMSSAFTTLPPDFTVKELLEHHILGSGRRVALVTDDNAPLGMVTLHQLREMASSITGPEAAEWLTKPVTDFMIPFQEVQTVMPEDDLWTALQKMDASGVNQLPVVKDNQVVGMLTREQLVSFLHRLAETG